MNKRIIAVLMGVMLILAFGACKKAEDETKPVTQEGAPGIMMPQGPPQVVVPDSVQGQWKAVKLAIENKQNQEIKEIEIPLNGEYKIPDSDITIKVGDFLPDFKMEGNIITSTSNELNNPSVKITVMEGENQVFDGWLYAKFPAIHPFQHEKYGLLLKEGVSGS